MLVISKLFLSIGPASSDTPEILIFTAYLLANCFT
jgi:hypothetical protein